MQPETHQPAGELREYLRLVRRRKATIILAVLVVGGAAFGASVAQQKIYQGTATLVLTPRNTQSLSGSGSAQALQLSSAATQTQIQIISSEPVRAEVQKRLGTAPSVSVVEVGQTNVVRVQAQSPVPRVAAQVANTYAQAYIDVRRGQALDDLDAAGRQVKARIDGVQAQLDALPPINPVHPDPVAVSRRQSLISQQDIYRQRLDQIQVDAGLNSGDAQLVNPASVPTSPVKPTPKRNALIGGLLGLLLGIGLAFLRDYLDDSIKNKDDVERASHGLTTMGVIPAIPTWKTKDVPRLVSVSEPTSSAAEAYRALRTAIQFTALDRPMRTVQVTSPSAAEGKTTTLANLGVALARAGQRVVLVDCDLRRPRIHQFFGLPNEVGFTSVLLGEVTLADAVQEIPDERLMMLLASGVLPPNPSELLSSRRTVQVLSALQAESDIVLLDCPPILPVTDASVLSARVDATLLVTSAGQTTRKALSRAIELLRQVDAPLVGTVFNGVSDQEAYGYAYKYSYYYRREDEPRRAALKHKS